LFFMSSLYGIEIITIGTIDSEPENKFLKFEPLSKYIQKNLNNKNIKINTEIPKDINTAINLILSNKLDIFIDSVYPTILVQEKTDISIEAKRWKKGSEGYNSIIFTKKDSTINSIKDLVGKKIAFEDEFSTSAYYIPRKVIEKYGLLVSNKGEKNSVMYSFARTENNTATWLLYNKVDAAVTDNITYNEFDQSLFKVIYKSELIPRHLVSFSKRVRPKLKKQILDILFNMHKDKEGLAVLKEFSKTEKFSHLNKKDLRVLKEFR
ncbi:MAG: phosphate/phosphite/phosphonate ABC transporter substrate-binding protein, partial [Campylobacteraceae bacterium]|nr:phosphate/phosphite/phosphonate ABC transporter substrate-binding protein [Campylobacteraceae bacterium]